jgi:hypothetical protein
MSLHYAKMDNFIDQQGFLMIRTAKKEDGMRII